MNRLSFFFIGLVVCIGLSAGSGTPPRTAPPVATDPLAVDKRIDYLDGLALRDSAQDADFSLPFVKDTLANGLNVIYHLDRSDPVVAVVLSFHVGSAREQVGKSGFAHLFEHLLFLGSENLGIGGLDTFGSRIGGSDGGSTSRTQTRYYQTAPSDALEKILWAEAEKLGFFINTISEPLLAKEKEVVKNEKRQRVDNVPYGHEGYVTGKALYPEDHPYSWRVIGSMEDLDNATLDDVRRFYASWYGPNNAVLVVAGDFDLAQAREWVEKYFGEIPRGPEVRPMRKRPAHLTEVKRLFHEDNFARLPQLTLTWPTVPSFHPDAYALSFILPELLAGGEGTPLYEVIVEQEKMASSVYTNHTEAELAGEFTVSVRAYPDTDLDDVLNALEAGFDRFEREGVSGEAVNRIKAQAELTFYGWFSSVLDKAQELASYNLFIGDPGYAEQDLARMLAITPDDVRRVYETYIKDRPYVATSFVPKDQAPLALEGSARAEVVEEEIVQEAEAAFDLDGLKDAAYERTPSRFDRSIEPPFGSAPEVKVPDVWTAALDNGLGVYGIESHELPLVQFSLRFEGGLLLEDPDNVGVANLLAALLMKGTKHRTPQALEEAIDALGARIEVSAGRQHVTLSATTLARTFDETLALVEEILLEPRWDADAFALIKQQTLGAIAQQQGDPDAIASTAYHRLLYGADHILSHDPIGTEASVGRITLDDLKTYYARTLSPSVANFHVVGAVDKERVLKSLSDLEERWPAHAVVLSDYPLPPAPERATVYFYDVPQAKQSVLHIGFLGPAETDPDFYPLTVANYILGGGGFASRLMQEVREGKGYTYTISSRFTGTDRPGPFRIASHVRSNVTYESVALIKEIMERYPGMYTEADLTATKNFLQKSRARSYERLDAKLDMLQKMSTYGWNAGFVQEQARIVEGMSVGRIRELAQTYLQPDKMIYLIVGDAEMQFDRLKALGYGDPILINEE